MDKGITWKKNNVVNVKKLKINQNSIKEMEDPEVYSLFVKFVKAGLNLKTQSLQKKTENIL